MGTIAKSVAARSLYLRKIASLALIVASFVLLALWLRSERWPAFLFLRQTHDMVVWSTDEPRRFRAAVTSPGAITVYDFTTTPDYDGVLAQMIKRGVVEVGNNVQMFFETGPFVPAVKLPSNQTMTIRLGPVFTLVVIVAAALSPELCTAFYRRVCLVASRLSFTRRYSLASLIIAMTVVASIFGILAATD